MQRILVAATLLLTSVVAHAIPVESNSEIAPAFAGKTKLFAAVQGMIRGNGYQCDSLSSLYPFTFGQGYRVSCNHWSLMYELKDQGNNNWLVTQK